MNKVDKAVRFFTGMNERSVDAALSGFADSASYYGIEKKQGQIVRRTYQPKSAIHQYISAWVESASEELSYTLRTVMGEGDKVMIEWEDVAKAEGKEYTNCGVLVFSFNNDGDIHDVRAYYDFAPLQEWHFLND